MLRKYDALRLSDDELKRAVEADERLAIALYGDCDRTTRWEGQTFIVEWTQKLRQRLEAHTDRIVAAQGVAKAIIDGRKMGKLHETAQRIAATKKRLDEEADKLMAKLDTVEASAPAALQGAHALLDQHKADLDAMETELRQLSNLPLA